MSTKILPYIFVGIVLALASSCKKDNTTTDSNGNLAPQTSTTLKDLDGNSYRTVVIGTQT